MEHLLHQLSSNQLHNLMQLNMFTLTDIPFLHLTQERRKERVWHEERGLALGISLPLTMHER